MSKTKSVVMTAIITVVLVLLCLMCVVPEFSVPFRVGGVYTKYNSVVNVIRYGSDLGGGYCSVYYPDGVISAADYDAQVKQWNAILSDGSALSTAKDKAQREKDEYVKKYVAYTKANFPSSSAPETAAIYLERNEACYEETAGVYTVNATFESDFKDAVNVIAKRFDKKNLSYLNVSVRDDYTIEVDVPRTVEDPDSLFTQMSYTGEFTLRSSTRNGALLNPVGDKTVSDYFESASSVASGDTGVVVLKLTSLGKDTIYEITDKLREDEEDATLYFYVGYDAKKESNEALISLKLSDADEGLNQRTLYISGSFTPEQAENVGIVIDSCIRYGAVGVGLSAGKTVDYTVGSGKSAVTAMYIALGALILASFIFFLIRYRGLGVAHIYGYISYLICMLMFIAFLGGMSLTASGVAAVVLTSVLLTLSNVFVFENVRKEFATGKTLTFAIKAGYKRSLAPVLDTHLVLLLLSFVSIFVGIGEASVFAYIFLLGVLMSGISVLLLTRYYWHVLMGLVRRSKQYSFCGFKWEVDEDEE